jgi:hypothetical protein
MSYLNPLRLTFAGTFQAAPSTVNNDPTHFNNATFKPEYQQRGSGATNGWWNPRGDANWRMIGCAITSAWLPSGQPASSGDAVLTCSVADSDLSVAAKLVDLDTEQQLVSEIWGMQIRIADAGGNTLMRSQYKPAAFTNIWNRWPAGRNDGMAGAMYQSVLTDVEWGDVGASPFLIELRKASADGLLSIKFNVDAYDGSYTSPTFTLGRVVGTIGPATAGEPHHFVMGRQFLTTDLQTGGFFAPAGGINFGAAVVDEQAGKVFLDLGNSLPTDSAGGPFSNLGTLSVVCQPSGPDAASVQLGEVDYRADGWYERTAGVVALPPDRALTADELKTIGSNPLVIQLASAGAAPAPAIRESPGGLYVRADQYVFRLNPGDEANVRLFASVYGRSYANAQVVLQVDPSQLQAQAAPNDPQVALPAGVLQFLNTVVTGNDGLVVVTVRAGDPGNPRGYIDGQIYGIRPVLKDTLSPSMNYPFNPWDFVSFLVWDQFKADPPTWHGCLQPVFQQYANLYPIMDRFLDLSSYDSICENLAPLTFAFGLDPSDPNSMPVTRDLSGSKRKAILQWLKNLQDGKPLLGVPSPAPLPATVEAGAGQPIAPPDATASSKLAAAMRRLARRPGPHQT